MVCLHTDAGQRSDGPAGTMIAGNPLGKNQCHLAGLGRNMEMGVIDIFRRVGEIDEKCDGQRGDGAGEQKRNGDKI